MSTITAKPLGFLRLTLLLLMIAPITAAGAASPTVKETSLGSLPKGFQIISNSIKMSPDLRHVAYAAYSSNTKNIIRVDNTTSPVYYAIQPGFPIFSPDKNRTAYIAHKNKNQSVVVVDGRVVDTVDKADHLIFSPDGSRYACRALKGGKQMVILDGAPGPSVDGIPIKDNFAFSPDGRHFIYVAFNEKSCTAMVDRKAVSQKFQFIESVRFSPDSTHFAYKARVEKKQSGQEKWRVVRDGNPEAVYDKIFDLIFSYDSKRLAYAAIKDKRMVMVVDGQPLDTYDVAGLPVFSFDSRIFAYGYALNDKWYIMQNGEKSDAFDQIYKFYFSPDSSRSAFFAKKKSNWYCVVNGDKGPGFEKMVETFKFSLDSRRYVYAGVDEEGSRIVVDDEPGPKYQSVGEPYFSPDSRHVVYRAIKHKENQWITVLDGRESAQKYNGIGRYEFSTDSRHLVFPAFMSINQSVMVVDGIAECADRNFKILGDPTFSPDGNYIVYHARAAEEKWHLIINGRVLPQTYGGFFKGTPVVFDASNRFHTLGLQPGGTEFVVIDVEIPPSYKLTTTGVQ